MLRVSEEQWGRMNKQIHEYYWDYESMLGHCMELVEERDKLQELFLDMAEKYRMMLDLASVIDDLTDKDRQALARMSKVEAGKVRKIEELRQGMEGGALH